jgi:hypothetical protein
VATILRIAAHSFFGKVTSGPGRTNVYCDGPISINRTFAHADAPCRPSGTIVENPIRRMASPMRRPASKLPPSELKATKAEGKGAVLAANSSPSIQTRGPSTMTTSGRSAVCGLTVMVAAGAGVVASRIHTQWKNEGAFTYDRRRETWRKVDDLPCRPAPSPYTQAEDP